MSFDIVRQRIDGRLRAKAAAMLVSIEGGLDRIMIGWLLVAGPLPAWRGMRDDRAMRNHHVEHPHMYLWFLGVDPAAQGTGVGKALLAELHGRADDRDVPTYLETGTMDNVPWYGSSGYQVIGEMTLPHGRPLWRMERPQPIGSDLPAA